jgi:predicted hotdog family 3-hydroxylacyl-ACP dehydratase
MLLLDRLIAWDDEKVLCEVRIVPTSPFLERAQGPAVASSSEEGSDERVPAVVGIEYMAQTVAVFAGLRARASGAEPRIGFLIGCRELLLSDEGFQVGDVLVVEARHVWGETEVGSFACKVSRHDEVLVSGTLTVYQGPLPSSPSASDRERGDKREESLGSASGPTPAATSVINAKAPAPPKDESAR